MARVDFEKEYYCGFCGNKFTEEETKFKVFFGVKIPVKPRNDGNVGCPNCNNILRRIPRNTKKTAKVARL
jgi:protein-disulfide isomerase